jgi:aspartate aminotransferase
MGESAPRLAKRVRDLSSSATLEMAARARQLAAQGKAIVNFAAGELNFDTPEFIKKAAIAALNQGFTKYTPAAGTPELKEAISEKFQRENGLSYSPNQIVVSCGAKHSLFNLIQVLCDAGEEVLFPSPYWVSYPEMVRLAQAIPVTIPTSPRSQYKITVDQLKKKITPRTRLLLLNSPSNPTGAVYLKEELQSIAKIVVEKNLFCVSDEIYEKILYEGARHYSIASFGEDIYCRTATVNGVSKSFSMTGWRIGYLGAPEWVVKAVTNYQSHSTSNPASISQKGALAAIKADEKEVLNMLAPLKERRSLMLSELGTIKNIQFFPPMGACYVFCDISKTAMDSVTFATRLLEETGVVTVPGEAFGERYGIRLSFAASKSDIQEGMKRLKKFVEGL